METKQCICLEVKKGDFVFTFTMPVGASYGNAMDAAFDVLTQINALSAQAIEQAKPKQVEGDMVKGEVA